MPLPSAAGAPHAAGLQQHHQTVSAAFAAAVAAAASGSRVSTGAVSETSQGSGTSSTLREALQRMNPEAFARDEAIRRRASNGGDA